MNYEYENNVYIIAPTDVPLFRQKKIVQWRFIMHTKIIYIIAPRFFCL